MAETLDLDAIKARCEAATPGPWVVENAKYPEVHTTRDEKGRRSMVADCFPDAVRDAEFIAHARTDIPALIAEIERLRSGVTADV